MTLKMNKQKNIQSAKVIFNLGKKKKDWAVDSVPQKMLLSVNFLL